jgi:hypothetical protein
VLVYAVVDDALSPDFPLGNSLETFIRGEDAERFVEGVRGNDSKRARTPADRGGGSYEAGGLNQTAS